MGPDHRGRSPRLVLRASFLANGNFAKSASDLAGAVHSRTDNPYFKLLLYLAEARSGNQFAQKNLEKNFPRPDKSWPYGIVRLFLQQQTPEETLNEAKDPDDACEAAFYLGEWYLLRNGHSRVADEYKRAESELSEAVDRCPHDFIEWLVAKVELNRAPR
jgi:lipoprotein NlpI